MSILCARALLLEPRPSSYPDESMERSQYLPSSSDSSDPLPISFYPPLYSTPIQQLPPPPPSSPPSSPYVLNHKRRSPSAVQFRDCEGSASDGEGSMGSSEEGVPENVRHNHVLQSNTDFLGSTSHNGGATAADFCADANDARNITSLTFAEHAEDNPFLHHSDGKTHAYCQTGDEFYDASEGLPDANNTNDDGDRKMESVKTIKPGFPNLSEEVARRIRAEESLASLQSKYNEIAKKCLQFGHSDLVDSNVPAEEAEVHVDDPSGFLSQKLIVARAVAASLASAAVRAEKDEELQSMLTIKSKEISRLQDKLQYYELVNREMSQRNQEILETTQRRKARHQKRQKFILGCLAAALCAGTSGLVLYKLVSLEQATTSMKTYNFKLFSSESSK